MQYDKRYDFTSKSWNSNLVSNLMHVDSNKESKGQDLK